MNTKQRNKKRGRRLRWVGLRKAANDMTTKELHAAIADVCWIGDVLDWELRSRSSKGTIGEIACNRCGSVLN